VAVSATAVGAMSGGTVDVLVELDELVLVDVLELPVDVLVEVLDEPVDVDVLVDVEVLVLVEVGGGPGCGTRTSARNRFFIVSGGSRRSASCTRFAQTVMRHTDPGASVCRGVSLKLAAGDELSANRIARPGGQASLNDSRRARTRSLNRIESTPAGDIDTATTRGARSLDFDGTSASSHDDPPATDVPTSSPSVAATSSAQPFHQRAATTAGDPPLP
jgi:hypothetical protein